MKKLFLIVSIICFVSCFPANADTRDVADGTFDRLHAKWFGKPQQIQLTPEEQAWLGKNHVVRVRVSDAPPWEINTPKPQGMSVDYLTIIGRQFGINFKFLPGTEAWIDGFNDMAGDHLKYDLLPAVKRTPERLALLAISDDYLHSPWVVFAHEKIFDIFSLENLRGRKVTAERGYVMQKLLEMNEPEIELVIQESTEDALIAVSTMKADAYVGNLIVTSHLIQRAGIINVKVACPTPFGYHSQAMATRQEWTPLISIINKGLTNISQKEKTSIQNKYSAVRFEHGIRIMDIIKWVIGVSSVLLTILSIILILNRRLKREVNKQTADIKAKEERLRLALEVTNTGLLEWFPDTNEGYLSPTWFTMLGYQPDEFPTKYETWTNLLHPEDRQRVERNMADAIKEKKASIAAEFRMRTKQGGYRWIFRHDVAVDWDESGSITRIIATHTDITERKLADEALRQSKEFNQSILNSLQDHIAVLDSHGTILTVNDTWTRFAIENDIYFPESVGPGVNYLRICRKASKNGDETVAKALDGIQSVIDGSSENFDMEYACDSPTAKRWFLMRVIPFTGRRGKVLVAHSNITSRKMAEEEMMKSEERSRKLMEHSPIAIAILTPDGEISHVNAAWKKLWGLSDEETAQVMASYNFLTDKQVENLGHAPLVERAFKGEHIIMPPINYEGNRTIEDIGLEDIEVQSRMIQIHIYSVKDDKGEIDYVVAINMDFTELQQAEQEALVQRESLARMDRATRMGQLTGSIAHELNQPLTGILSNAQAAELMLKSNQWKREDYEVIIAEIVADTKRAGEVIRNLRELYREHKGEYTLVDINSVAEEAIKLMNSEFIMKQVEIISELVPSIPLVNGNKFQLQQVLINLIMNAEQAMSSMKQENRKILIVTDYDENQVKVCVDDFGPGIEVDKIDRIFEPLVTWKPGGTGMGLAIGNSIITAHGGRMWAENRSEGGARVGFAIPVLKGGNQS